MKKFIIVGVKKWYLVLILYIFLTNSVEGAFTAIFGPIWKKTASARRTRSWADSFVAGSLSPTAPTTKPAMMNGLSAGTHTTTVTDHRVRERPTPMTATRTVLPVSYSSMQFFFFSWPSSSLLADDDHHHDAAATTTTFFRLSRSNQIHHSLRYLSINTFHSSFDFQTIESSQLFRYMIIGFWVELLARSLLLPMEELLQQRSGGERIACRGRSSAEDDLTTSELQALLWTAWGYSSWVGAQRFEIRWVVEFVMRDAMQG